MTTSISDSGVQFADGSVIESAAKLGLRNKIINGKMDIAQRGTSFAAPVSGTYTLDRWAQFNSSAAVYTVTQQADAPSDNEFQNSLRVAITTADTSIAAGDLVSFRQWIEGYNVRDLIGKTFTLSFRVRSSKTGVHCVSLKNTGNDRTYVAEYTINSANTWETKSITVSGGLITAGTWNWTTGQGLGVEFTLAAGSTYQTTAGAWQTGNYLATANQVNCLDTIGNIFAITGVQLEVGSVATPFEQRPYGMELALCQRYYEKSYAAGTASGTATTANACAASYCAASSYTSTYAGYKDKRAAPTYSYWDCAGNASRFTLISATSAAQTDNNNFLATSSIGQSEGWLRLILGATAGSCLFHFTADAEL